MAMFNWNDSYSVKVALCDQQHKKLFQIINELSEAMRSGRGQEVVRTTVAELLDYTRAHFQQEEAMLQKTQYPQLAAHQAMHRKFVADVEALERQIRQGHSGSSVQVLTLLRDWLLNHIQKVDKSYSAHLNASGIH